MSVKKITLISIIALLVAHIALWDELGFVIGIIVVALFIFYFTLNKNDVFSFIMIMYFCTLFPYATSKGGIFNLVALVCVLLYFIIKQKIPNEMNVSSKWFNFFILTILLSSIMGWIINFVGTSRDLIISILSFLGVLSLLMVSSKIFMSEKRIYDFVKLNMVLIFYSLMASLNKYINFVSFETPMFPKWGESISIESGGIIGVSPIYGQHSMIVVFLFAVFFIPFIYNKTNKLKKRYFFYGLFLALINVFFSVSKAVFSATLLGIFIIIILQYRIIQIRLLSQLKQILILLLSGLFILFFIRQTGLDYVFERFEYVSENTQKEGGVTFENVINGTAVNRSTAFNIAKERLKSRQWWIGYGYGLYHNNRNAFYVNSSIKRGSAHSQYFATLFIFGWFGFVAFWALHIMGIRKSWKVLIDKNNKINSINKIYALFSFVMIVGLMLHGYTADNISVCTYFGSSMILIGLSYGNINSCNFLKKNNE